MAYINDDWLQYEYETMVLVKYIENNLNQINRDYFEGNLGILSVTLSIPWFPSKYLLLI